MLEINGIKSKSRAYAARVPSDMKTYILISVVALLLNSCAPTSYCTASKHYLSKIDTLKPFMVKGTYCIQHVGDDKSLSDSVLIRFKIYSRIKGTLIKDGVVFLNSSSEKKVLVSNGMASVKVPSGKYSFDINCFGSLGLRLNNIEFKPNSVVEINTYLGDSYQI